MIRARTVTAAAVTRRKCARRTTTSRAGTASRRPRCTPEPARPRLLRLEPLERCKRQRFDAADDATAQVLAGDAVHVEFSDRRLGQDDRPVLEAGPEDAR